MSKTKETSKHNHSCQCDHENVQFCKTCKIVHCLDCKIEWTQKYTYSYPWNWYYTNGIGNAYAGNNNLAGGSGYFNSAGTTGQLPQNRATLASSNLKGEPTIEVT